jgi:hypothetical protein
MVMEPKCFDIRKVKVGKRRPAPGFMTRIRHKISQQKKVLTLRWEFLDLSLSGVVVYGLVILLAFGSAILTTRIISASFNKKPELEVAPSFSSFEIETEASEESTLEKTEENQPAEEEIGTENPFEFTQQDIQEDSKISKGSFSIRILNGNGRTGDAAKTRQELLDKGFKIGSIGNARYRYSQTQIYHLAGKEAEAALTAESLGREAEIHQADGSLIGSGYDILIVLGLK